MDSNLKYVIDLRVKRTIENLEKNNMEGYYVEDSKAAIDKICKFLNDGDTVSVGGSMTLFEIGIIDLLRGGKYKFLDRYEEGLSAEQIKDIFRKSFMADAYLVSSNAVTESGELYNVDGNGNRVAAMLYGPDKVIVVIGINKIVKDIQEAESRMKYCSAPSNAKRINRKTPCSKVGYCMECDSPDRICNDYVIIKKQAQKGRIKVIIVGKELGY